MLGFQDGDVIKCGSRGVHDLPDYQSLNKPSHIDIQAQVADLLVDMTCAESERCACRSVICRGRGTGVFAGRLSEDNKFHSKLESETEELNSSMLPRQGSTKELPTETEISTIKVQSVETGICMWVIVLQQQISPVRSSVGNVAGKGLRFIAARIAK